jgi:two-component system OmpR family response regulator
LARTDTRRVQSDDIYALTGKGEQELRGSGTTLSPAEIELLVRLDGAASAGEIAKEVKLLSRTAVLDALRQLREKGLISLEAGQASTGELGILFEEKPATQPTRKAVSAAKAEAGDGVSSLKKQGFYARIARRRAAGAKPGTQGKALHAIVVEDEPHLAKFLAQYLNFEGFQARIAANREQIVAEFRRSPVPDLVLLDVMLPDADGFDILLRLRQHPALKSVPVIMLTAKATREAVLKGLAGGADGYVTKPFEADALIKAIRAVVGLPGASADQASGLKWY